MRKTALQHHFFTYCIAIYMACCTQGYSFFSFFCSPKKSASQEVNEWVRAQIRTLTNETVNYSYQPFLSHPLQSSDLIYCCSTTGATHKKLVNAEEAEALLIREYTPVYRLWNNIPELRPYLGTFPLSLGDVYLTMESVSTNGEKYCEPNIGLIKYVGDDEFDVTRIFPPKRDSYGNSTSGSGRSERKRFTASSQKIMHDLFRQGIQRKKFGESITPPIRGKEYYSELKTLHSHLIPVFDICWKFAQQHTLNISAVGRCAEKFKTYRNVSCSFWSQREESLQSTQALAKKLFNHMYTEGARDRSLQKHLRELKEPEENGKLQVNDICFRISFWDQWVNRVEVPYIAEVRCLDGIITYFTADERQHLVKVFEEPVPQINE